MKQEIPNVYIGIGSSAGGFEALMALVATLPKRSQFFYFLAQHHARDEKNLLPQLLQKKSTLDVVLVKENITFEPNILYVVPPELKLINKDDRLAIIKTDSSLYPPLPNINDLLKELSSLSSSKVIAIILSGTGDDGSHGVEIVKENNGITIAQTPNEAMFHAMPSNAIKTDSIDYVLNVKDIGKKLSQLSQSFEDGSYSDNKIPFDAIKKMLHSEKGIDLFRYKEETLLRRIEKRIEILHLESLKEYFEYLKKSPQELQILHQEIFIGVTHFFRGKESFEALAKILKTQLLLLPENSDFRVWSVACSTGEEAYTLAIILSEISKELHKKFHFKIFASDINEVSLKKAKQGEYSFEAFKEMEPKLFKSYFEESIHGYKAIKSLKEMIIFTNHNFLSDAPFLNLDFLSCRNVFIYLKITTQKELFGVFHYALKERGLLFLGSSESTLHSQNTFITLDTNNRIYQKSTTQKETYSTLTPLHDPTHSKTNTKECTMKHRLSMKDIEKSFKNELFKYFESKSIIIDTDFTIIYKKGENPYLNFSDGIVSLNILHNLEEALRYEAKALLERVLLSNTQEKSKFVQIKFADDEKFVQMIAQPFFIPNNSPMILLNFEEIETKELFLNTSDLPSFSENLLISNLSEQLKESRDATYTLSNELQYTKQNMELINEELEDSNEKLQSTVEELETSNEELQSSNEELIAALSSNKELQNKLSLILKSSVDGILGLDMEGRHTFVNDKAAELLGYSKEYLSGKNSHKIWHHTKADGSYYPEHECPINKTLQKGEISRGEDLFWKEDGSSFPVKLVRSPIIEDGLITGALISFHDITKEISLTQEVESTNLKYEQTFKAAQVGIAHVGLDGSWLDVNEYLCKLVGYSKKELLSLTFQDITHPDDLTKDLNYVNALLENKLETYQVEKRYIRKNSNTIWVNLSVVLVKDSKKNPLYFISIIQDISQRKMLMFELELKKNDLENVIASAPNPILLYDEDGKVLLINRVFQELTGYAIREVPTIEELNAKTGIRCNKEDTNNKERIVKKLYSKEKKELLWVCSIAKLANMQNNKQVFIASSMDITEIQRKEELMLAQSRQAAMGDMIGMIAHQWRQPLSVISMAGNSLKADLVLENEITKESLNILVNTLNEQTQSLSQTIEDFRTFFKPEKEKEKISLCDIYEKLRNMIQKTLQNNQISLQFINDCDVELFTYPNEFLQIFINLLNNAKDAIKERNIHNAHIDIKTSLSKKSLKIEIKDNAGGIDKKILAKLGEPYVSTKRKNGTGLGIYMSKMILEKHLNGTIQWKNIKGGSSFTITLPLKLH